MRPNSCLFCQLNSKMNVNCYGLIISREVGNSELFIIKGNENPEIKYSPILSKSFGFLPMGTTCINCFIS